MTEFIGFFGRHSPCERTRQEEVALKIFVLQEPPEILSRRPPFLENAVCPHLPEPLDELLSPRPDASAGHTAISARCRLTECLAVEKLNMLTCSCKFECC